MPHDWQKLIEMTGGKPFVVQKVGLTEGNIAIEGEFELPPLAKLSSDEQIFLAAFVRSHGSIKQMESYFGVSYPTIKNRLNRLAEKLEFVEIEAGRSQNEILDDLEQGEISVEEALLKLRKGE